MSNASPFSTVASDLLQTIDAAAPKLRSMSERESTRPLAPGKWSPKQVIGHLIDSAANNHQRFVRALQGPALTFPAYEQNHWVSCQRYEDCPWADLTGLWHAYNRHLAHVIRHIPEGRRHVPCTIEANGPVTPVTLEYLTQNYVVHLRHHLSQVGALTSENRS